MKWTLLPCMLLSGLTGYCLQDGGDPPEEPKPWALFQMDEVDEARREADERYREFFRAKTMHLGLYTLATDAVDRQSPHTFDEAYYVLGGSGKLTVEGEELAVEPGSVVYVHAGAKHRFHSIAEELELLVFFSTAKPQVKLK